MTIGIATASKNTSSQALILANVMIGTSSLFVLFLQMDPIVMGFYRMALAATIFLGVGCVCNKTSSLPLAVSLPKRWWCWMLLGGFCWVIELIAWQLSIGELGPGGATLLNNLQLFVVPLLMALLRYESFPRASVLGWGVVALLGLVLALNPFDESFSLEGFVYGAGSGIAYSGYVVALRIAAKYGGGVSSSVVMQIHCLLSAIIFGVLVLLQGAPSAFDLSTGQLLGLVAYASICQVGGWTLIQRWSRDVSASRLSIYLLGQPVTALVLEGMLCGKRFGVIEVGGVALVMIASLGISSRRVSEGGVVLRPALRALDRYAHAIQSEQT
jgi:drug/metabolite transporter (DMT)-like permease